MGRKIVIALGMLVVLAALGFLATRIYASMQTGDDVPAPAVGSSAPAATAAVADLDGDWTVADGSEAGYRVDEVLSGQDVTVVGRTEHVTGSGTVADGELTAATVEVDLASITTDESARDGQFQGILDTRTFPTATFELTAPVDVAAVADGETVTVDAPGSMTIKGTTRDVTAGLEIRLADDGGDVVAELAATVPVTFADYGVQAPDLGFVTVEDTGFVEAELTLSR
ncbi:YceI family protein [Promicromonospora sukumoe]|uniref:YceI family protein n=1 Tax=Promicromonospora sukumoe TaxID=88382 RepID=UPI00035F33C9|nr:YceI family protein [Promicromonospora sukumoe]